jgi:hypothetical protein
VLDSKATLTDPLFAYQCPLETPEAPRGLRAWPAVLSFPKNEPPLEHWPNIVSLITGNESFFDRFKEPLHHDDPKAPFPFSPL